MRAALAACALAAAVASAGDVPKPGGPGAGGHVPEAARKELQIDLLRRFDYDRSGALDAPQEKANAQAYLSQRRKDLLDQFDADKDGKLNPAEQQKLKEHLVMEAIRKDLEQRAGKAPPPPAKGAGKP